jgi:hypothetical protein
MTTQTSCTGNTGTITITATGGVPPYMYSKDGGLNFQTSNIFNNLGPGNYPLVIKDANGCQASGNAIITALNGPQITNITVKDTKCGLDNGENSFNHFRRNTTL